MKTTIVTSTNKTVEIEINFITSWKAEIKFLGLCVKIHNSPSNNRQISTDAIIYSENKGNVVKFDNSELGFFDFNHVNNRPNVLIGLSKRELQNKGLN